jgi:hypothetical protein
MQDAMALWSPFEQFIYRSAAERGVRQCSQHRGHVRVEKGFRLGGHRSLAGFVDVFNLLNTNPEQNTSGSPGPCSPGRSASCRRVSRGSV